MKALLALMLGTGAMAQSSDPVWVPGSSQKVCQLIGDVDHQTGQATVSKTATNYGLTGTDLGYSFQHNGKVWFLFGDSNPAAAFNGKPNAQADPPRIPADNDSIGFTSGANVNQCLKLDFVRDSIGAYQNPVVLDAQGKPAITLGSFEVPIAGIDEGGKMFVIFGTEATSPFSTRSVVGMSADDGLTYHYLYDFSAPPCTRCDGAKFVNVAIGRGTDSYLYFWGSEGGTGYRHSPVFLARKPTGTMTQSGGIQYFSGLASDGTTPNWSATESGAVGLFQDYDGSPPQPANCVGELGVDYNQFVQRWVLLYNCLNQTANTPRGIYMRSAQQPWGPWSAPQTIFNGERDRGVCHFIHRAVTSTQPACDTAGNPGREDTQGGDYGPYFVPGFTTSSPDGTSTFYHTLSTWNPYVPLLMKSTIQVGGSTSPVIGLVANAEGESTAIAPNTWLEIKGLNLAPAGDTRTWQSSDFANGQMPTQLDGVSVMVNGKAAFVYYISPTQVNVLTPPDAISGSVQVLLTYKGQNASYTTPAQGISPSFFVFDTVANLAATHVDGSLIGPTTLYPGSTTPAKPGETIVLYANGFGPTSTPVVSGSTGQSGTLAPLPVVKIGGVAATVLFAGLVSPGEFQFNVIVPPNTLDGNQPVTATYNGATTQAGTQLTVQH